MQELSTCLFMTLHTNVQFRKKNHGALLFERNLGAPSNRVLNVGGFFPQIIKFILG